MQSLRSFRDGLSGFLAEAARWLWLVIGFGIFLKCCSSPVSLTCPLYLVSLFGSATLAPVPEQIRRSCSCHGPDSRDRFLGHVGESRQYFPGSRFDAVGTASSSSCRTLGKFAQKRELCQALQALNLLFLLLMIHHDSCVGSPGNIFWHSDGMFVGMHLVSLSCCLDERDVSEVFPHVEHSACG